MNMPFREKPYNCEGQLRYSAGGKPGMMLMTFCALMIACLFYATGNFGFLSIFGAKREVQTSLILGLLLFSPVILVNFAKLVREPIFLLALLSLLMELILRRNSLQLADFSAVILVIGILLSVSRKYSDKVLKFIIVLAASFSAMAIVQAVIVLFNPEIIPLIVSSSPSIASANKVELLHPLGLLGFTTGDRFSFLGGYFTRFKSFASEPSVLVCSFLIPGILGLTYKGYVKACGGIILFFVVFLAQSGVMWISLLIGVIAWGLFHLLKHHMRVLSILPFLAMILFLISITVIDIPSFMSKGMELLGTLPERYAPLRKSSSGTVRLEVIADALVLAKGSYTGTNFDIPGPCGLIIRAWGSSGVIGTLLLVMVLYRIFRLGACGFNLHRGSIGLSIALLYGTLIQASVFSDYGWFRLSGFVMLTLMMHRLEVLASDNSMNNRLGHVRY